MSSNIIDEINRRLKAAQQPISSKFQILYFNITTGCFPSPSGGRQCQCGDQFAWSCDKCELYGACSNTTGETCSCINGVPADQFCQPISSVPSCPTPTSELPSTIHPTNATTELATTPSPSTVKTSPTTVTTTTTPLPPAPAPSFTDLVFDLRIPIINVPYTDTEIGQVLGIVKGYLPRYFSNVNVLEVNLTTVCVANTTGELTCECQDQYAWSCDRCKTFVGCNNTSTETCCINGPNVTFCELNTSIASCPATPEPPIIITTKPPTPVETTPTTPAKMTPTTPVNTTTTTTPVNTTIIIPPGITPTTTTTKPPTTPATTTPTTTVTKTVLKFSMDLEYKQEYNDATNSVYLNIFGIISPACKAIVPSCNVDGIVFSSGSTVASYTISATSIDSSQIQKINDGVVNGVLKSYPVIFEGTDLKFSSATVISGTSVDITCGSPEAGFNFGPIDSVAWTIDGAALSADTVQGSLKANSSILTGISFAQTGDVPCVCLLRAGNKVLRRRGTIKVMPKPDIKVTPLKDVVLCGTKEVTLTCSVQSPYKVRFEQDPTKEGQTVTYTYPVSSCVDGNSQKVVCQWVPESYAPNLKLSQVATLRFANQILCRSETFGDGTLGYIGIAACDPDKTGEITAECMANGNYENVQDNCVLKEIQNLLDLSEALSPINVPPFLKKLSNVTKTSSTEINKSPATIGAIVKILDNVANLDTKVDKDSMTYVLETSGTLTRDDSQNSWIFLNKNDTTNANGTTAATSNSRSSLFLNSLERLTGSLSDNTFVIDVPFVILNKTTFTNNFNFDFNSSVVVNVPQSDGGQKSLTVVVFSSMNNVLPPRDQVNTSTNLINGKVTLIRSSGKINNISLTFDVLNDTLHNPKCVYWNFSLFNGLGGWDDEGCFLVYSENGSVSCNCNHLTSFSILMSPFAPDIKALAYITYVGITISLISLVICLIIEAIIWHRIRKNSTSFLRHVSIVNIALSLLIANIWFIIAANISDPGRQNAPACTAATYFIHFFYLAMFFWMLSSALLLVYRTMSVFGGISDIGLLGIGFALGYGAPLIIASITIAVTAGPKKYIQKEVCWLNWFESKALLAFVIPALSIVVINLIILIVVLYKILRRRVGSNSTQEGEKHVLIVIAKSLAVLTPIFGLTWGLGIGTMVDPRNVGVHISFAFFNSLQGFFILVFGVLLDKKVLQDLRATSQSIFSGTKSTSGGTSSSIFGFLRNRGRGGGVYVSTSGSSNGHSSSNT